MSKVNVKNPIEEAHKEPTPNKRPRKNKGLLSNTLFGGFMEKRETARLAPYFILFILMSLIYITNAYVSEKNNRKIQETKQELIKLRYEYISSKSQLMDSSRQSYIARKLEATGIKESTVPPTIIIVDEE